MGSNIGASLAANFLVGFTPDKIKKWFIDVHPNDLNHSIKMLFIQSVQEALNNISILFLETQASNDEKKQAKQLIKTLKKSLPDMFLNNNQIQLEEPEIKHFLYEKDKEELICNFIANQFDTFGITESFKSFLAQNLPAQIQLCFGEGLKAPTNHNAWIAFQRMLIEEIRNDIKQIAGTQQSIKDDLTDLKFEKSGFSEEQIAEIRQLVKILNDKKLVEVKIRSGVNQSLKSIENKANEVIRITTKTQITVDELKIIIKNIERQNHINQIIIYSLSACLIAVATFGIFKLIINQPFDVTVQIVDWNDKTNNQEIYDKGGFIHFGSESKVELTTANSGKFKFSLANSHNKDSVRVYFQPQDKYYQFMKLDTTIFIQKDNSSPYCLKMKFDGIDKITRQVLNEKGQPIAGAIAEINGVKDTTDADGNFTIVLPVEKQQRYQILTIKKEGYEIFVNKKFDMILKNSTVTIQKK